MKSVTMKIKTTDRRTFRSNELEKKIPIELPELSLKGYLRDASLIPTSAYDNACVYYIDSKGSKEEICIANSEEIRTGEEIGFKDGEQLVIEYTTKPPITNKRPIYYGGYGGGGMACHYGCPMSKDVTNELNEEIEKGEI